MVPSNSPNRLIGLAYGVFSSVSSSSVIVFRTLNHEKFQSKYTQSYLKINSTNKLQLEQTFPTNSSRFATNLSIIIPRTKRTIQTFRDPSWKFIG